MFCSFVLAAGENKKTLRQQSFIAVKVSLIKSKLDGNARSRRAMLLTLPGSQEPSYSPLHVGRKYITRPSLSTSHLYRYPPAACPLPPNRDSINAKVLGGRAEGVPGGRGNLSGERFPLPPRFLFSSYSATTKLPGYCRFNSSDRSSARFSELNGPACTRQRPSDGA